MSSSSMALTSPTRRLNCGRFNVRLKASSASLIAYSGSVPGVRARAFGSQRGGEMPYRSLFVSDSARQDWLQPSKPLDHQTVVS